MICPDVLPNRAGKAGRQLCFLKKWEAYIQYPHHLTNYHGTATCQSWYRSTISFLLHVVGVEVAHPFTPSINGYISSNTGCFLPTMSEQAHNMLFSLVFSLDGQLLDSALFFSFCDFCLVVFIDICGGRVFDGFLPVSFEVRVGLTFGVPLRGGGLI
jgi:hypothetical protein